MTPGEYEVIAMADGYEPLAKLIEVSEHGHSGTDIFLGYFLQGPRDGGMLRVPWHLLVFQRDLKEIYDSLYTL